MKELFLKKVENPAFIREWGYSLLKMLDPVAARVLNNLRKTFFYLNLGYVDHQRTWILKLAHVFL